MMTKAILVFIATCILHHVIPSAEQMNQTFDITCDPLSNTESPKLCENESLETIAAKARSLTKLRINLRANEIQLTTQVNFTNLSSLIIIGESESNSTTIICNSSDHSSRGAGIVMSEIAEITLKNLHFSFCGSFYVNKYRSDHKTLSSALVLFHCQCVEMHRVTITRSKGIGLLILNHHRGQVNISLSKFKGNVLPPEYLTNSIYGGGGVYILLAGQIQETVYSPMMIHFHNCTFESNKASTKHYKFHYTNVVGESITGYGRGGGVHLSIMEGISNVSVSFSSCLFKSNEAFIGGGISVKTYIGMTTQTMTNIQVEISDSLFRENGCTLTNFTYYGGGACFAFIIYQYGSAITESHYSVRNVSFINNCGKIGGGVIYLSDRNRMVSVESMETSESMAFENCAFSNNNAYFGSAVFLSPNVFKKLSLGSAIAPSFTNCHFMNNSVSKNTTLYSQHGTQSTVGIGTIYASAYNAYFHGYNSFEGNWGTAIYVVHGVFNFQNSSALFINNTGNQGGAVALIGSSMLTVGPRNYSFINNRALYEGGAIYVLLVDNADFITSRSCFIQYEDSDDIILANITWNSNINFIGNRAQGRTFGHAIYATSVHSCEVVGISTDSNEYVDKMVDSSKVFTVRGIKFDDDPSLQPQIATSGALLNSSKPTPLVVIPGQECDHGVTIKDDLGHKVETLLEVSVSRNAKNVRVRYSYIGDKLQLRGKPGEVARLYLKMISQKNTYIEMNIKILDCPPGFMLNDDFECTCRAHAYWGLIKCDLDTFRSHLAYGLWAGLLTESNGSELVISNSLFFDYGNSISNNSMFEVVLPQNYSELNRAVCGETRTGFLCGRCQENYTVHFHSPGFLCKPIEASGCKIGWLWYILSELVPVTMVFIAVLLFNINFTSGAISSFILFGQLLNVLDVYTSGRIAFPDTVQESVRVSARVYTAIYGFINLDYFSYESISFCLLKHASALDMLTFKYVTILYTLLMIVAVILFVKKCAGRCCGRYCRITAVKTSMIHGISTFLVICYSQCIKVSLNILASEHPVAETGGTFKPSVRVWYNGEILYFSRNHLPYVPAIIFLCVIGIFPPVLLLSYPLLNKLVALFRCDNHKVLDNYITKTLNLTFGRLKPLLDSFQGCFKDNYRFFSGLYFLYSFYNYHKNRDHTELGTMVMVVAIQLILIYLPLIIMGIYVIHAMVPVKCKKKLKEFIKTALKKDDDSNGEEFVHLREIDEIDNHYHRIEDLNRACD